MRYSPDTTTLLFCALALAVLFAARDWDFKNPPAGQPPVTRGDVIWFGCYLALSILTLAVPILTESREPPMYYVVYASGFLSLCCLGGGFLARWRRAKG
ncbi:MAG TPA: hypothetical protein VF744_13090 [Beijerinckiaceae bacterium]